MRENSFAVDIVITQCSTWKSKLFFSSFSISPFFLQSFSRPFIRTRSSRVSLLSPPSNTIIRKFEKKTSQHTAQASRRRSWAFFHENTTLFSSVLSLLACFFFVSFISNEIVCSARLRCERVDDDRSGGDSSSVTEEPQRFRSKTRFKVFWSFSLSLHTRQPKLKMAES